MTREPRLRLAITHDWTPQRGYFLKEDCKQRFASLGVELVPLIENFQTIAPILKEVDGLVIPGGVDDVDPCRYGQEKKHERVRVNTLRTDFEFRVLEEAFRQELPVFTICWGLQILNVFLGGSLHQHLPEDKPSPVLHEQSEPAHLPTHWVTLESAAFLKRHIEPDRLHVNSTHHQAIDRLGRDLVVEAHSEDGLIEAARYVGDRTLCFGVQWHPERLAQDPIIPLFLAECLKRKR